MTNSDPKSYQSISPAFNYEDEISLYEILSILWRRKVLILISVFVCVAITGMYLFFFNKPIALTSTTISLNFKGIEKHINPDGSTFNKSQIIGPPILSNIDQLNNRNADIIENIGDNISIEGVIPPAVAERLEKSPDETFLPNLFTLTIKSGEANPISDSERYEILTAIFDEYKNDFSKKYINEAYISDNFPADFFDANDYNEILSILVIRINKALNLLDQKIKSVGNYHSPVINKSFTDLRAEFQILKSIDIKRLNDVADNLNLTKNKTLYEIRLKQQIKSLEMANNKETARSLIAEELLRKIMPESNSGSKSTNVNTGIELDSSFIEKLRKENNLSYLLKTILESKSNANNYLLQMNKIIERLEELSQTRNTSEKTMTFLESSLKQLISTYRALTIDLNALNREFLTIKYANAIKIERLPVSILTKAMNTSLTLALAGIASLFISIFAAFFIEYLKNETINQSSQEIPESNQNKNINQLNEPIEITPVKDQENKRNFG